MTAEELVSKVILQVRAGAPFDEIVGVINDYDKSKKNIREYKGWLSIKPYGENDDTLFMGNEPLAIQTEELDGKTVSVRYFTSDKEKTKDEILENFIKMCMGRAEVNCFDRYTEITGYIGSVHDLMIGGHDLLYELESFVGQYCVIEAEIH